MTTCSAKGCAKELPVGIPFCHEHYWMLPKDMTRKLLKPKSSEAYFETLEQAVGFIAEKEKK
jgi:hypothetical protein